jgi:ERCC4-related helicase
MIDAVEYVEKCFNIELNEYQKILINNAVNEKCYITYPPRCGRTFFTEMINEWNELNKSKN